MWLTGDNSGFRLKVEDDDGPAPGDGNATVDKGDNTLTFTATAALDNSTIHNPFERVHIYAAVPAINTGTEISPSTRTELRLITTVAGVSAELDTRADRVWIYERDVSVDDVYATLGKDGIFDFYAIGVNDVGVALVSQGVKLDFAKR